MDRNHNRVATDQIRSYWRPSSCQLLILLDLFRESNGTAALINEARLEEIAEILCELGPAVTKRNVQKWFRNRRYRRHCRSTRTQGELETRQEIQKKFYDQTTGNPDMDRNHNPVATDQIRSYWRPSSCQLLILWDLFRESNGTAALYNEARLEEIAEMLRELGPAATKRNVQIWFRNRRYRRHFRSARIQDELETRQEILKELYDRKTGNPDKARLEESVATLNPDNPIAETNLMLSGLESTEAVDESDGISKRRSTVLYDQETRCPIPSLDELERRLKILKMLYDQETSNPEDERLDEIIATLNLWKPIAETNLMLSGFIADDDDGIPKRIPKRRSTVMVDGRVVVLTFHRPRRPRSETSGD